MILSLLSVKFPFNKILVNWFTEFLNDLSTTPEPVQLRI